jgi:hypothetical protein
MPSLCGNECPADPLTCEIRRLTQEGALTPPLIIIKLFDAAWWGLKMHPDMDEKRLRGYINHAGAAYAGISIESSEVVRMVAACVASRCPESQSDDW